MGLRAGAELFQTGKKEMPDILRNRESYCWPARCRLLQQFLSLWLHAAMASDRVFRRKGESSLNHFSSEMNTRLTLTLYLRHREEIR